MDFYSFLPGLRLQQFQVGRKREERSWIFCLSWNNTPEYFETAIHPQLDITARLVKITAASTSPRGRLGIDAAGRSGDPGVCGVSIVQIHPTFNC